MMRLVSLLIFMCAVSAPASAAVQSSTPPPTDTVDCKDVATNCDEYGNNMCFDYEPWARTHCSRRCGFCVGGPTTPTVCENTVNNCPEYGTYICTETSLIIWTKKHCAKYCGLCGNGTFTAPTTPPPTPRPTTDPVCRNLLSNCAEYGGKSMCTNPTYTSWAHKNCRLYCGFCVNVTPVKGITLSNNVKCPDWMLPTVCTMGPSDESCCPVPQCPDGFSLTAKLTSEFNLN